MLDLDVSDPRQNVVKTVMAKKYKSRASNGGIRWAGSRSVTHSTQNHFIVDIVRCKMIVHLMDNGRKEQMWAKRRCWGQREFYYSNKHKRKSHRQQ